MKTILFLTFTFLMLGASLPGLQAEDDPYVYFNDVEDPSSIEDIKAHFEAHDVMDGDLTDEIYVKTDHYSGNEETIGDFIIIFGVEDSAGQETTFAVTVRTRDITPPEITISDELPLRLEIGSSFSDIEKLITAYDSFEGDVTEAIEYSHTIDFNTLGEYQLDITVEDSSENIQEKTIDVIIYDPTPPELEGPEHIIKHADYILSSTFFLDYFEATHPREGDITDDIEIRKNEYTGNADSRGSYDLILAITDEQGNTVTHDLTIEVKRDIIPLLIIDHRHLVFSNGYYVTDNDFIDILRDIDDVPNQTYVFSNIHDTYNNNYNEEGEYSKQFRLTSSSGEEFTRTLTLKVIEHDYDYYEANPNMFMAMIGFIRQWWIGIVIGFIIVIGFVKGR